MSYLLENFGHENINYSSSIASITKNINMLQDDSNGETFEIIDKKTEELSLGADKAGSYFGCVTLKASDLI